MELEHRLKKLHMYTGENSKKAMPTVKVSLVVFFILLFLASCAGFDDDCSLHEAAARQCVGSLQRRLGQDFSAHLSVAAHDGPLLQNNGGIPSEADAIVSIRPYIASLALVCCAHRQLLL